MKEGHDTQTQCSTDKTNTNVVSFVLKGKRLVTFKYHEKEVTEHEGERKQGERSRRRAVE